MSNEAIKALIEKLEAGEIDAALTRAALGTNALHCLASYNGSVDAAIYLLKAVLPDHHWLVERSTYNSKYEAWVRGDTAPGESVLEQDCPARALLLATLRAMQDAGEAG